MKSMKVFGVNVWLILLIVLVLLVVGLVIVRKVYRKLANRKAVVTVTQDAPSGPGATAAATCTAPESCPEPEETKEIEEIVKNALGEEAYTMEVKEPGPEATPATEH
jgi:flagellar biosynthesis/type III secretory pathway M-ring protein FliF/YscJ